MSVEAAAAREELARARAYRALGDLDRALAAAKQGLALVAGTDSEAEARLAVETTTIVTDATFDLDGGAGDAARNAVAIAHRAGACESEALLELAKVNFTHGRAQSLREAEDARRAALARGDVDGVF